MNPESATGPVDIAAHLQSLIPSADRTQLCTSVLPALIDSIAAIAQTLRRSYHVSLVGTANAFGDDQLNVDVLAENAVRAAIAQCPSVVTASSEEDPIERPVHGSQADSSAPEQYTVAFDPLDGSSIIAPNWTVGTIIGVWDGSSALHRPPAESLVAAVLGVHGPRTTVVVALRVPGTTPACFEVALGTDASQRCVMLTRPAVRLASGPFKTRYFAPANLRAAAEDEKYMALIAHYVQGKYTLRYSGGLVPDVVHMLVKGHGVYLSPVTGASKAKLRRLYELYPVALIVECAGGRAVDPADGQDILARTLEDLDERAGLLCGNAEEVKFSLESLLGSSSA